MQDHQIANNREHLEIQPRTQTGTNTNVWLREKTKVKDVIEQVRTRTLTWARHVSRIRGNRWTLRITT